MASLVSLASASEMVENLKHFPSSFPNEHVHVCSYLSQTVQVSLCILILDLMFIVDQRDIELPIQNGIRMQVEIPIHMHYNADAQF